MLRKSKLFIVFALLFSLTGCLYPDEMKRDSNASAQTYITLVQSAVEKFKDDTGVLPIKNSQENTPLYEKYQINFEGLVPRYLDDIPANEFAKGGHHIYVLVDVETKPTVKLLDLRIAKTVRAIQQAVDQFRIQQGDILPAAEQVTEGVSRIDFAKMNLKTTTVTSPFSNQSLPLLITDDGLVIVDYSLDIYPKMQEQGRVVGDLRQILVSNAYFIPVNSLPYKEVRGEPVIDYNKQ